MRVLSVTTPNGEETIALVIGELSHNLVCYSKNNMLFTVWDDDENLYYGETMAEHCIIPEYDKLFSDFTL